jgi:serine/threonine protein kinase
LFFPADFGISKITKTEKLEASTIAYMGTPHFIPPEILYKKPFEIIYYIENININQTYIEI